MKELKSSQRKTERLADELITEKIHPFCQILLAK